MSVTKATGTNFEGAVMSRLIKSGVTVLMPIGNNERYDLVLDRGGNFERVQVKAGRLEAGAVRFETSSTNVENGRWKHNHYQGQVDTFGIYCPELDRVYMVPVSEVGNREGSLRIDPTKNGQVQRVRWAKDYELQA